MSQKSDFLHLLAQRLLEHPTKELHKHCFVFPSHRAGIFFHHYVSQGLKGPAFAPQVMTIEELTTQLSAGVLAERPLLLCLLFEELRKIRQEKGEKELSEANNIALDHFERILGDFNDIDLFLAPAGKIFKNMDDLDALTSLDYLTDEQRAIIIQFWGTIPQHVRQSSTMESSFFEIFSEMELLYSRFRQRLAEKGLGYSGMLVRYAAEMDDSQFEERVKQLFGGKITQLTIAGLYQITPAERTILQRLQQYPTLFRVNFLWEEVQLSASEALIEKRDWTKIIGNAIEENKLILGGEVLKAEANKTPRIDIIKTSSETGRSKIIPALIQEIEQEAPKAIEQLRCAIVLPQELSLPPLLEAMRQLPHSVNITMGYPLSNTSVAIWLQRFYEYQINLRSQGASILLPAKRLKMLLRHPMSRLLLPTKELMGIEQKIANSYYYIEYKQLAKEETKALSSPLSLLIAPVEDWQELLERLRSLLEFLSKRLSSSLLQEGADVPHLQHFGELELEFVHKYSSVVGQMKDILQSVDIPIDLATTVRLLRQLIEGESTPFEGEPLLGLQIMGFLESRLVNFDYLIIPDTNEGILPRSGKATSGYIPHSLRLGYGLPTYRHNDYIEAYHFYRLIGQAQRVFFVTGSSQDYEPSRYIGQLRYLFRLPMNERTVKMPISDNSTSEIVVEKDAAIMEQMSQYLGNPEVNKPALSASSLYDFTQCSLRFYYKYICGIGEPQREDELLTPGNFGSIVHNTMQRLYQPFEGKELRREEIEHYLDKKGGAKKVEHIIKQEYAYIVLGKKQPTASDIEGVHEVYCRMVYRYVHSILTHDATYGNIFYIASEHPFVCAFPLPSGQKVRIKGFIDRVDRVGNSIRIIDYKTGNDKPEFKSIESLFFPTDKEKASKVIPQLLLYCYYWQQTDTSGSKIQPTLYALKEISKNPTEQLAPIALKESSKSICPIDDYNSSHLAPLFEQQLGKSLSNLFDPKQPFTQTTQQTTCTYCPFVGICGR